ncbi:MAG: OmpA family protein [Bacteroidetes bacterium]|nr:OmpA family protein [Bacteroidota bacterium]
MKKNILLPFIILCLLSSLSLRAQGIKENLADKYYRTMAYEKAAPMYAELSKKKEAKTENIRRAADSYRFLNMPSESEKWYSVLSSKTDVQPQDHYNYAQILFMNGKYKEGEAEMKKFYDQKASNSVAKRYYGVPVDYTTQIKRDSLKFSIKHLDHINTPESDFAPSYMSKTELIYTSNKENHGANNRQFAWDNTSFLDLYTAKIDSSKQEASEPRRFDRAFKTSYHDGPVSLSADGLAMLITRSNYFDDKIEKSSANTVNVEMYYATRTATNVAWSELKAFPYNNKDYSVGHGCFSADGKTIYFISDMPGTYGNTDIWKSDFNKEQGSFTQPQNLGQEINTEGREMFPFVDEDDLMFFASDGHVGLGGLDIHIAQLLPNEAVYIANAGYPMNTNFDDFAFIYDPATLKGYFSSNRPKGSGKDDIYAVKIRDPFLEKKVIQGIVRDEKTGDPIPFASVKITDDGGNVIEELKADNKGYFSALAPKDKTIQMQASKDDYMKKTTQPIAYKDIPKEPLDILLNKKVFRLDGLVLSASTNEPLEGAQVSILDATTNRDAYMKLTDKTGTYMISLDDKKDADKIRYVIHIEKPGFKPKNITIEKSHLEFMDEPLIKLIEKLEPENGTTPSDDAPLADLELPVIYFDLDKSDIRPDAMAELDKFVEVLKNRKDIKIEISSSTDCRASESYNMALSQRRAQATADYLKSKGISAGRLKLKWTGESQLSTNCPCEPTNESGCSEEQHQLNRKSSFRVTNYKIDNKLNKGKL